MDKTILRRLGGEVKVRKFSVLDIEARQWVHPYAVGFYDGTDYVDFVRDDGLCIGMALEYILRPERNGHWIYAHNGGNYDFLFLIKALLTDEKLKRKYLIDLTPIGSTIIRMDVSERKPDKHNVGCVDPQCRGCGTGGDGPRMKWSFIDSARLMPLPLKDLGETFGITKKVELEMSYDDLAKEENRATMKHYLQTDCVSLYEALGKMQTTINNLGGQLGVTLPSTALDVFRRKFLREDISTNRHWRKCPEHGQTQKKGVEEVCKGCMHEFIREAYFGGRSEIFRMKFAAYLAEIGDEWASKKVKIDKALMYDFNSHYPNCMLSAMPTGEAIELEGLNEQAIYENAKQYTGIVECDVEIPDDCYLPPLPVRHEGKLIFPTGKLRGVWDAAELALLPLVGGRILETRRSLWFENTPVFNRFVKTLYKFRDKRSPTWTKGMDFVAKILLNSAYGKFAMKENRSRILVHPDSPTGLKCIDLECDVWQDEVHVSPSYIVPQLSVHVTALARVGLWKSLKYVLDHGGRIYYTDTDSVVCSGVELPTSGELGGLKLEAKITRAEFVLPKLYLIETEEADGKKKRESHLKIKAKGMGPGIRVSEAGDDELNKQLSEKEFIDLVTKGVPIQRHRLSKLREGLRDFSSKALSFPRVVHSPKKIQSEYDKRTVDIQTWDTLPLRLEQF